MKLEAESMMIKVYHVWKSHVMKWKSVLTYACTIKC